MINTVTWDKNFKGNQITLQNNALSVAIPSGYFQHIRATHGVTSGKYYYEASGFQGSRVTIGVTSESTTTNPNNSGYASRLHANEVRNDASCGWMNWLGIVAADCSIEPQYYEHSNLGGFNVSDTIGIAMDMNDMKVTFYRNGVETFTWPIVRRAIYYPAVFFDSSYGGYSTTTANFGATPFKYSLPDGFKPYQTCINTQKYFLKNDQGYQVCSASSIAQETCIPNMISNTEPEGEVSCSSYLGTWYPHTVFNATTPVNRGWESDNGEDAWIQYKFTSPKKIVQYYIRGCNDDKWGYQYNPAHWRLEASNDGINYIVLHESFEGSPDVLLEKTYAFPNHNSYYYYRLHCLKFTVMGWHVISRLKLYEELTPASTEIISVKIPTEEQFLEKGMDEIPNVEQLTDFDELITYSINSLIKSLVTFKPKDKTICSTTDISLKGRALKKAALRGTDHSKVLFSKDRGVTWHNKTEVITISNISTQGLTPAQLAAIAPAEWKSFLGDAHVLRFAYYLPDATANTDKLELTADFIWD